MNNSPEQQAEDFQALRQRLTKGSKVAIASALADREVVEPEPEPELTPEILAQVRSMINARK
jgi:hypothetical protein